MYNKRRILTDDCKILDNHTIITDSMLPNETRILFINDETGEVYREEHNRIVIAGAQRTACKHYGIEPAVEFTNYNTELGIHNTSVKPKDVDEFAYLFCCGTSGCGIEASQVYPVTYHSRIHPNDLVPFRYENIAKDLSPAQRKIYFGRKEFADEGKVAYYYKAFDSKPQMYAKFLDGTMIDGSVYGLKSEQKSNIMVQTRLKITKSDFRDWFFTHEGIENARINTLSILTAWKHTDPETGYEYYNNVQPLTQLNFTNEWLIDLSKSITILYQTMY